MILYFKITPLDAGFTETWIHPDYTGLKFRVENNNAKGIFAVTGNIKLFGDDYDFFKDSVEGETYEINVYKEGVLFLTSDHNSTTVLKEDVDFQQLSIKMVAETEYISDDWQNIDKEYNINTITPETNDLHYVKGVIILVTYTALFSNKRLTNTTYVESSLGVADWDIEYVDVNSSVDTGPFWEYDGTVGYVRQKGYGYTVDGVDYEPNEDGNWTIDPASPEIVNGISYPIYFRSSDLGPSTYNFTPGAEPWTDIDNTMTFYNFSITEYTGVTRTVTGVIEWLFTQMGLTSIAFDSGGTATDSFYSFKTMVGESLTYGSDTSTLMYSHLLIMNVTDFIPTGVNVQKSRIASITNVSLQTLLDYFESIGFEWFLQNRVGTFYFILQHKSDKSLGATNPVLTDYFNKNRTYLENNIEIEPPEYHKIINEMTNNSIDFREPEIIFTALFGTTARKVITDNKIFVDIDDIALRREDAYSEKEDNNIVIIAAQQDGVTMDYVRQATGILTLLGCNNCELSFTYLGKNIYCEYPNAAFDISSNSYTAAAYRLKKRNIVSLKVPYDNIKTAFLVSDYVAFGSNNAEIGNMEQAATDNIGPLILKF